jgi:thiamine transporter ThiT
MEVLGMAFLTAMAFIILLVKMGLPKFLRFGWQTDVIISGVLAMMFFGTFAGMLTGLIAGIFVSLFLSMMKWASPPRK